VSGQPAEHEPTHSGVDEGLTGRAEPFVIPTEPPVLAEPREGALDHPAPGQHSAEDLWCWCESFPGKPHGPPVTPITVRHPFTPWLWRMSDDLDSPPKLHLDPMPTTPGVALVDPDVLDPWELIVGTVQQQRDTSTILNVVGVHLGAQDQATGIDQDVAFAAIHAFGTVVAAYATHASCPDGLAVDDRRARLGVAADTGAQLLTKHGVQVLPRAVQAPEPEVVVGRLPGWELVREQSPSAATAHHVEDRVQDLAERVQPRSPDCLGRWEERVQASEFSVSEVGQVRSPRGQTPAILPGKPTHVPVFRQFLVALSASAVATIYVAGLLSTRPAANDLSVDAATDPQISPGSTLAVSTSDRTARPLR